MGNGARQPRGDPWPDEDDAALVARAAADPQAFAALSGRYVDRVHRFCDRTLGSRQAAEDVTASVVASSLAALPRYREGGAFSAWLFSIARNAVINGHRQRRSDAPLEEAGD